MPTIELSHEASELINFIENSEFLYEMMKNSLNSYTKIVNTVYFAVNTYNTNDLLSVEFKPDDIEQVIVHYMN